MPDTTRTTSEPPVDRWIGDWDPRDTLPYVVQCKWPNRFFEAIAAFNVDCVAIDYAADCQRANPQFEYRVMEVRRP